MSILSKILISAYNFIFAKLIGVKNRIYNWIACNQLLLANVNYGKNIRFYGKTYIDIHKKSSVKIGDGFTCSSGINYPIDNCICSKIVVKQDADLIIGNNVGMSNVCIHCHKSVHIGNFVNLGAGVKIFDTDFHSLDWRDRMTKSDIEHRKCKPIKIGDAAFIGANTIILKGSSIGEKSIIGAGSVITGTIPPMQVWAGNPARFIKKVE